MYAIIRADLEMPPGKLSAQAGHAYTDSLMACLHIDAERIGRYRTDRYGGSKVTLQARNVDALLAAKSACEEAGIPCALVIDRDHVLPPHFDGSPIITALGIGPVRKSDVRHITKKLRCV